MHMIRKLITGSVAAAALAGIAATPAVAVVAVHAAPAGHARPNDPPTGTVPREGDVVGVGSDTDEFLLDQLSHDYNASHTGSAHLLYSWDALNPMTGGTDNIVTKSGCAAIPRPDGSGAGITAFDANAKTKDGKAFCIDYARSARGRSSSDPPKGPGGILFVELAKDAISYATQSTTNAPGNLTTAQLNAIYNCADTNWSQVGGKNAPIHAFLPNPSQSGMAKSFLTIIGVTTPGSCVNQTVQQNEGIDPLLKDADAIVPYSIAKFIAQRYHSAKCLNSSCTAVSGVECKPAKGQNLFGCDEHGTLKVNSVNGIKPTAGTAPNVTINSTFGSSPFGNPIYDVVRFSSSTPDNIPANLEPFFASATAKVKGWACSSKTATADIKHYGDLPVGPLCGIGS
jgi:ABC-type phosphate transport system substrate-binding protein